MIVSFTVLPVAEYLDRGSVFDYDPGPPYLDIFVEFAIANKIMFNIRKITSKYSKSDHFLHSMYNRRKNFTKSSTQYCMIVYEK